MKKRMVGGGFDWPRRKTYLSWQNMRFRCENPKNIGFKDYGGRGIKVCERWKDFENFISDMGYRPSDRTLDRIDNNGNYEPSNCRWATKKEQNNNQRNNIIIEINGIKKTLPQWADYAEIPIYWIRNRLRKGWQGERLLSKKKHNCKLSESQIREISELLSQGLTQKAIGERYGVTQGAIRYVKNNLSRGCKC